MSDTKEVSTAAIALAEQEKEQKGPIRFGSLFGRTVKPDRYSFVSEVEGSDGRAIEVENHFYARRLSDAALKRWHMDRTHFEMVDGEYKATPTVDMITQIEDDLLVESVCYFKLATGELDKSGQPVFFVHDADSKDAAMKEHERLAVYKDLMPEVHTYLYECCVATNGFGDDGKNDSGG